MVGGLGVEDCCFVKLRCSVDPSREIRENVWRSLLIRRSAQENFELSAFRVSVAAAAISVSSLVVRRPRTSSRSFCDNGNRRAPRRDVPAAEPCR